MSPPASAAIALLGLWVLMTFAVTATTVAVQPRATRQSDTET